MTGCERGRGMMWAGILVILIGLGIGAFRVLQIPRYWAPLAVGIALLVVGAWRTWQRRAP